MPTWSLAAWRSISSSSCNWVTSQPLELCSGTTSPSCPDLLWQMSFLVVLSITYVLQPVKWSLCWITMNRIKLDNEGSKFCQSTWPTEFNYLQAWAVWFYWTSLCKVGWDIFYSLSGNVGFVKIIPGSTKKLLEGESLGMSFPYLFSQVKLPPKFHMERKCMHPVPSSWQGDMFMF